MTWTVHLPFDLKSKNRSAQSSIAEGRIYKARRDSFALALRVAADAAGVPRYRPAVPIGGNDAARAAWSWPVRAITIVRLMGKGQREFDSLAGGDAEALRDACQRARLTRVVTKTHGVKRDRVVLVPGAGIVWDDSAKWSRWEYRQERAPDGKPGVRLEIEDVVASPTPILDAIMRNPDAFAAALAPAVERARKRR